MPSSSTLIPRLGAEVIPPVEPSGGPKGRRRDGVAAVGARMLTSRVAVFTTKRRRPLLRAHHILLFRLFLGS